MRLIELKNIPIDLETIIENISPERRERLKKLLENFNILVDQGVKSRDQLGEYIEENYESI